MSDYTTMQSRIADELGKSNLTTQIQYAIKSAIKHYDRHRFWFNEATGTFSTVASQEYYTTADSVPDFVDIDNISITVNSNRYQLFQRQMDWIDTVSSRSTLTGYPTDYCLYKQSIRLYPIPNGIYTVTLAYMKKLAALSLGSDTNAWMVEGEELIRARAKWDLYLNYLRDYEGASGMKTAEDVALRSLNTETDYKVGTGSFTPTQF